MLLREFGHVHAERDDAGLLKFDVDLRTARGGDPQDNAASVGAVAPPGARPPTRALFAHPTAPPPLQGPPATALSCDLSYGEDPFDLFGRTIPLPINRNK